MIVQNFTWNVYGSFTEAGHMRNSKVIYDMSYLFTIANATAKLNKWLKCCIGNYQWYPGLFILKHAKASVLNADKWSITEVWRSRCLHFFSSIFGNITIFFPSRGQKYVHELRQWLNFSLINHETRYLYSQINPFS